MGYSVQNTETGEVDFYHDPTSTTIEPQEFDEETGEPLNGKFKVHYVKHNKFQIPKKYLRGTLCEEMEMEMTGEYRESYQPISVQTEKKTKTQQYNRDDYIKMEGVKNDIILGYNKVSYHVFLIPTLFIFNVYVYILLALIESVLHFWAHKKNGLNSNKEIFYRSPMHVVTSQFCAICRYDSDVDLKVFDMLNQQMRKARESQTLKDVSKVIS